MNRSSTEVSIVVPVFNNKDGLKELLCQLTQVSQSSFNAFEIIAVNDGSTDKSWDELVSLSEENPYLIAVNLSRNFGQHNALLCGLRIASKPLTVTIDDDLQHSPQDIPTLINYLESNSLDVVYGVPEANQHSLFRSLSSSLFRRLMRSLMRVRRVSEVSAFRVFKTDLRSGFSKFSSPFVSIDVLLSWTTEKFGSVPTLHQERFSGHTNYKLRSLLSHSVDVITGFSVVPLRIASGTGLFFAMFGVAVLVYVLLSYIVKGGSVPGFAFLASTVAIFSGVQLFALGILGEYIGRIHLRLMERPTYTISEVIGTEGARGAPQRERGREGADG